MIDGPNLNLDTTPLMSKSKFWTFNAGQAATMLVFALGMIWATAVYATKSTSDIDVERATVVAMQTRISTVEARQNVLDQRTVAVETGIIYIKESLARIEQAVNAKK